MAGSDDASGASDGKFHEGGPDKRRDTRRVRGGWWMRAGQRGENAEPNLLPSAASTFHPHRFNQALPDTLCGPDEALGH